MSDAESILGPVTNICEDTVIQGVHQGQTILGFPPAGQGIQTPNQPPFQAGEQGSVIGSKGGSGNGRGIGSVGEGNHDVISIGVPKGKLRMRGIWAGQLEQPDNAPLARSAQTSNSAGIH
jgi:hypothetical protein